MSLITSPPSSSFFQVGYQLPEGEPLAASESRHVLVLGAGPGGLVAGIQALLHHHQVTILEKRDESQLDRERIIRIDQIAIDFLTHMGLADELKCSSSGNWTTGAFVPICELQRVLLAKFRELGGTIHFRTTSTFDYTLHVRSDCHLVIPATQHDATGRESPLTFDNVALVVIAEGTHSPTRDRLLGGWIKDAHTSMTILVAIGERETEPLAGWAACWATLLGLYYVVAGFYYYLRFSNKCLGVAIEAASRLSLAVFLDPDRLKEYRAFQQKIEEYQTLASDLKSDKTSRADYEAKAAAALKEQEELEDRMIKVAFFCSVVAHLVHPAVDRLPLPRVHPLKRNAEGMRFSEVETKGQFYTTPSSRIGNTLVTCIGDAALTVHPVSGSGANNAMVSGMTLPLGQLGQQPATVEGCLELHAHFAYDRALSDWKLTEQAFECFGTLGLSVSPAPHLSCIDLEVSATQIKSIHCVDPKKKGPRLILSTAPSLDVGEIDRTPQIPAPQAAIHQPKTIDWSFQNDQSSC